MKKKSEPIIFFGTEDFSAPSLLQLIKDGYNIASVVTKPDSKRGRGRKLTTPRVKEIALDHNIDVLQPQNLGDIRDKLNSYGSRIGVLVAYGKIIPESIIDIFELGIVNIHPSLLPKYRGPSPIEATIINGDNKTGISLMQISPNMDAGDIYIKKSYDLNGTETKPELYDTLALEGAELLSENLHKIITNELTPTPQDDNEATYCKMISKSDAKIDWSLPADEIERKIRAHQGWPGSKTDIFPKVVDIESAEVAKKSGKPGTYDVSDDGLIVFAGRNALKLNKLKPSGKNSMSADDFIRGYLT